MQTPFRWYYLRRKAFLLVPIGLVKLHFRTLDPYMWSCELSPSKCMRYRSQVSRLRVPGQGEKHTHECNSLLEGLVSRYISSAIPGQDETQDLEARASSYKFGYK